MQVVIADIEAPALEATAAELGVVGIRTDVSDAASVQALADETLDRFGAVHVVCNNAGVGPFGPVASATLDDWRWLIGVTVLCPGPIRTNLKTSSRNRPAGLQPGGLADHDAEEDPAYAGVRWLDPPDVGAVVVDAIKRGELYAITHPQMFGSIRARHAAIAAAHGA